MTPNDEVRRRAREITGTPDEMVARIATMIDDPPGPFPQDAPALDRMRWWAKVKSHEAEINAHRLRLAEDFGAARGWKLTTADFDVTTLAGRPITYRGRRIETDWPRRYTDHRYFFRADGKPAALVGHPYDIGPDRPEGVHEWASAHGLEVTFPSFPSWHFPGRTALVLFERTSAATDHPATGAPPC